MILILQCTKTLENLPATLQHLYVEMTSYLTLSKMPFTQRDGHLTKAFQRKNITLQVNCGKNKRTETEVIVD